MREMGGNTREKVSSKQFSVCASYISNTSWLSRVMLSRCHVESVSFIVISTLKSFYLRQKCIGIILGHALPYRIF